MRHRKAGRKLGRTSSHRKATLAALSTAVLRHKKIMTTTAKAKEARLLVDAIITRAKRAVAVGTIPAGVHARRMVARTINDRVVVKELFTEIAPKLAGRAGGYTRVVKLGRRFGDGAEVAILELVDYNTGVAPAKEKEKGKAKGQSKAQTKAKIKKENKAVPKEEKAY